AVTRSEVELIGAAEAVAELAVGLGGAGPRAIETRNLLVNAALTVAGAIARQESRGTHFRTDRPERDDERWRGHVVWQRGAEPRFEPVTAEETITPQEGDR
ncbi:MAG: L-aspartate oxidase, partial [Coriobacteriia bacterium]|nr:L-aspartate oxidase [Coriobacteriia bacterium]